MKVEIKKCVTRWYNEVYSDRVTNFGDVIDTPDLMAAFKVLDLIGESPLVLDGGCGMGRISIPCAKRGARVVGVDISPEGIKKAYTCSKLMDIDVDFIVADLEYLPFRPYTFDAMFIFGALEYISDPTKVLGGGNRALKPLGKILFNVWNRTGFFYRVTRLRLLSKFFSGLWGHSKLGPLLYAYSYKEVKELCQSEGFRIIKIEGGQLSKTLIHFGTRLFSSPWHITVLTKIGTMIETSIIGPYLSTNLLVLGEKSMTPESL